jgi:hypothetical protein
MDLTTATDAEVNAELARLDALLLATHQARNVVVDEYNKRLRMRTKQKRVMERAQRKKAWEEKVARFKELLPDHVAALRPLEEQLQHHVKINADAHKEFACGNMTPNQLQAIECKQATIIGNLKVQIRDMQMAFRPTCAHVNFHGKAFPPSYYCSNLTRAEMGCYRCDPQSWTCQFCGAEHPDSWECRHCDPPGN